MVTSYCDTDFWAKKQGYTDWDTYETANPSGVNETAVQQALDDATVIMNDTEHLNTSSNVTTTAYVDRLKIINRDMSNRILDTDNQRGLQGAGFQMNWEKWDYLTFNERNHLKNISKIKKTRRTARVVF